MNAEYYIINRHRGYFENRSNDESLRFLELYSDVSFEQLQELFAGLHSDLVSLFEVMNRKLPTRAEGTHYWAAESRSLLSDISLVNSLRSQLKDTPYAFEIDPYYDALFQRCLEWLSASGGSTIPPHTAAVDIYYIAPIFHPVGKSQNHELRDMGERPDVIGEGGFGVVYRYHHPIIDMDFAVKVYNPMFASGEDETKGEKRFFREAKMLFLLNHPNIVRIYDVGRIEGKPYMKMKLVDGVDLYEMYERYPRLPFTNVGKAIVYILQGLQHAHERGIIHRDLKPSNVMASLNNVTGKYECKIIDFGVSAFMDAEGCTRLTKTGEHVAGGAYIDSELLMKPELRDVRSDIYSVGAIMYFLLCGRSPGPDAEDYLRKSRPDLGDKQVRCVMKALASDINQRYASCDEMREVLEALVEA